MDPVSAASNEVTRAPMPEDYLYLELYMEPDIEKLKKVQARNEKGLELKTNPLHSWMVPDPKAAVPSKQLTQLVADFSGAPPTTGWKTWRVSTGLDYARDLYFGAKTLGKKLNDLEMGFETYRKANPDGSRREYGTTALPKFIAWDNRLGEMGSLRAAFFDPKSINAIPGVATEVGVTEALSHQTTLMSSAASVFFKSLGGYMGPRYKENWNGLVDSAMKYSYDSYRILSDVSMLNAIYKGQSGDYLDALVVGGSLFVRGSEMVRDGVRKAMGTWDATYNPKAYAEYLDFLEKKDPNAPLLAAMKKLDTVQDQKTREATFNKLKESMLSDVDFRKDMTNRGFFASYILPLPKT